MCLYKLHLITRPQKLMLKFLLPSLSFEIVFIFLSLLASIFVSSYSYQNRTGYLNIDLLTRVGTDAVLSR